MGRAGQQRKALTKAGVEATGPSPEKVWCAFWDAAERVGQCFVWRGHRRGGREVFIANNGTAVPAREASWVYDGRQLAAGEKLKPVCGTPRCIRASHQVRA